MGKMKSGKCVLCRKPITRHDANRISLRVSNKVATKVQAHLGCAQEANLG